MALANFLTYATNERKIIMLSRFAINIQHALTPTCASSISDGCGTPSV